MHQTQATSDQFIRLMQVIAEDKGLLQWFLSLQNLPENLRYSQLRSMSEKMKADRVDPDLVEALESLTSSKIYRAAAKTVLDFSQ